MVIEKTNRLVSIIIPTHNRASLICQTLDSIKSQTYKDIEIIVVDDNSNDNTIETLQSYKQTNPDFNIYLYKSIGIGACAARNMGIGMAKGDYIQFFDDDDLMLEDHIEKKVQAIIDNKCDYSACDYSFFDDNTGDHIGSKVISNVPHNCASHLLTKSFPCPSFMCTKDAVRKIGYWNESIKKLQDMAYFHRLFLLNMKGVYLREELFDVRVHRGSMTSKSVASPEGYISQKIAFDAIEKEWKETNAADRKIVLKALVFLKYTIGRNMYKHGFRSQGIKVFFQTFFKDFATSLSFLMIFARYKTIHITEALVKESCAYEKI